MGVCYYSQNPPLPLRNSYEPTYMNRKIWTVISLHVDQTKIRFLKGLQALFHDSDSGAFI
jgi:hypothetical protein